MTERPIPLVDLALAHERVAEAISAGMQEVLATTSFVLGPAVTRFEEEFARYCGVSECLGVANGTDAIELALRGLGIGAGDQVIIPANTFVATAEAVVRAGAEVVLADATEDYLIDPASVKERLTPATRAVIGVHLYGQMAPMEELRAVLPDDVLLVEDAAQSQGASRFGARAGSVGDVTGTSFYPGKNLGAYGDAGAVLTPNAEVAERIRAIRNHGGVRRYEHTLMGVNSRMDSLQAAVLSAKLEVLDEWNAERRAAATLYADLLADVAGVEVPVIAAGNEHVWHLYVVQVAERDRVLADLGAAGIGAGIHYPLPVHLLPAFAHLGHQRGDFPVSEAACDRILSLPLFPGITEEQQVRVVSVLTSSLGN
ncbi:DegT/DnrJ/EryC1/StrS family aminotransferase [Nocardioides sp. LHG3406-4]|uniref:DegT/DnrJ/EryC1/StrS family aminotransferase n=1 Tax=Nocardioides sp. LHG3406-4 TaxID=2804575 RepID=UPI003CEA0DDA